MSKETQQQLLRSTKVVRGWLIAFRILQVLLALVASAISAWGVAALARAVKNGNNELTSEVEKVITEGGVKLSEGDKETVSNVVDIVSYSALGISIALLVISLLTFILTFVWLIYTCSRQRRSRATCCGSSGPCVNYTCDIAWDSIFFVVWGALFALSIVTVQLWNNGYWSVRSIVDAAFCGALAVLFLITAILAGRMKSKIAKVRAQEGFIVGGAAPATSETYMKAYMPFGPNAA